MTRTYTMSLLSILLALAATTADARGKPSRGGSGVETNYGCSILPAGTVLTSPEGLTQKRLLMSTSSCYLCNSTTRVCTLQSPSSLLGWTFAL
jgi:hypothetical protein